MDICSTESPSLRGLVYDDKYPEEPGYYFVNNGYIDLVAFVFQDSKTGELMYKCLPSIDDESTTEKLSDVRDGLIWCRLNPPSLINDR
jgi:hypothetical protein